MAALVIIALMVLAYYVYAGIIRADDDGCVYEGDEFEDEL